MKKHLIPKSLALLAIVLIVASCVPGPNPAERIPNADGNVAGFFSGLWHGFIAPVTFVISVFSKSIRFYEVHNTGGWYNFGFVLGAGLFLSGGILGRKKKR
jgi:hypothetical protein